MKLYLVTIILSICVVSIQSRPQTVQIQKQNIILLQRSLIQPTAEQRGSIEETKRILKEIERINVAMGYMKKADVALPRTNSPNNNQEYFYPRPVYHPSNLRKANAEIPSSIALQRAFYPPSPYKTQSYFYPAPFIQLPSQDPPKSFHSSKHPAKKGNNKIGKQLFANYYILPIAVPPQDATSFYEYMPSTIDIQNERMAKAPNAAELKVLANQAKQNNEDDESEADDNKQDEEDSLIEDLVDVIGAVAGDDDDEEEEDEEEDEKTELTTNMPFLPNDKFINTRNKFKSSQQRPSVDMVISQDSGKARNFNLTNAFQNFTARFTISPSSTPIPVVKMELKETPLTVDGEMVAQDKGPFGIFPSSIAQKQVDTGGLVIQRLRVRQGGIAIAGPGGVATAGSGGTAIVGPNGTAITHPRSLTIAGPGAKIYAVPETTDLGLAVLGTSARQLIPLDAVLVAEGPVVYYRT